MGSKLIAMILGVALVATTATLPTGEAHAQAQVNTPCGMNIICTGPLASLTDSWWQLILSIETPPQQNPFEPTSPFNGNCGQLMQANTLFLVGQINPVPGVMDHGTCTISPGTSVIFPLVNSFWIDCQSFNQDRTHAGMCGINIAPGTFLPNGVKQQIAAVGQPFGVSRMLASVEGATGTATLDGVPLQSVRVQSPPGGFETTFAANNVFGLVLGPTSPWHGVADGFWVLLPSLPIGQHSLKFEGCLPAAGACQKNTYMLVVQ